MSSPKGFFLDVWEKAQEQWSALATTRTGAQLTRLVKMDFLRCLHMEIQELTEQLRRLKK